MALEGMATELLLEIGGCLPTDKDVVNFLNTSRCLFLVGPLLWQDLYAGQYDTPRLMPQEESMLKYQARSKILRKPCGGKFCQTLKQKEHALLVLKDLVLGSYSHVPLGHKTEHESQNLCLLRQYCFSSTLFDSHQTGLLLNFHVSLKTLQLVLSHIQLDSAVVYNEYSFPRSQKVVYENPNTYPLFKGKNGGEVDIVLLKHIVDFFKFHLSSPYAGTFHDIFNNLSSQLKPKAWDAQLQQYPNASKIGKHWLGTYGHQSTFKRIRKLRTKEPNSYFFNDAMEYKNGFQTLSIEFPAAPQTPTWPQTFENFLRAMPARGLCKQLHQLQTTHDRSDVPLVPDSSARRGPKLGVNYTQFLGSGKDESGFSCHGILHPLPPQDGFPGWQRITLMKQPKKALTPGVKPKTNVASTSTTPTIDDEINEECWCYEGVVLPGGKIILGRWWAPFQDPEEMLLMGPFIYWEVGADEEPEGMHDTSPD